MLKVQNGTGTIVEFNYDVLGRRYQKTTAQKTINYIYSNQSVLTEYKTENGETTQRGYIYGNGGVDDVVAYTENGNTYYIHKDKLGSTIGITDNSGTILTSYEYDSFGNFTQSGADLEYTRLFTGREYDSEIGLYYNRARYYNPNLGRFISRDPIDIQDDINLYAYVGNNPVNAVDLMGLEKVLIIGFNGFSASGSGEVTDRTEKFKSAIGDSMDKVYQEFNSGIYKNMGITVDYKLYESPFIGSYADLAKKYILDNKGKYNKIIILGHSMGADTSVELANSLHDEGINIDLLITVDLYAKYNTTVLEDNTIKAENYYQSNGILNWNVDQGAIKSNIREF